VDFARSLFAGGIVDLGDDHPRTGFGEGLGRRQPDPASGTCNDRDLPCKRLAQHVLLFISLSTVLDFSGANVTGIRLKFGANSYRKSWPLSGVWSIAGPMSTILVTGAAGFIGSHAILALSEAGHSVVAIDDLSTGRRWAVPAEMTFIQGDVGDAAVMRKLFAEYTIDAIMHFAGSIEVGESVTHPLAYYRNNTIGSQVLIEAAMEAGIRRIVFSSSAAVYGEPQRQPIPRMRRRDRSTPMVGPS